MTQLDEVARRIAALEFDAATVFKLGVALAPIVLGKGERRNNGRDHARESPIGGSSLPPVQAKRPNGSGRKSPLERALATVAANPGISEAMLRKRARCGASIAKRALGRRSNAAHDAEAAEPG